MSRLSLAPLLVLASSVLAAEPVWQIGRTDQNYKDLANAGNVFGGYPAAFPKDVHYVVGKSESTKDWSAAHPGPIDLWAGGRPHPFSITFDGPAEKAAAYELVVDIVDTQSQFAPMLRVRVNDQQTQTALDKGVGDYVVLHPEKGKHRSLSYLIPGDLLKAQDNVIELTITSGSWILYDAITLRATELKADQPFEASIQPTAFLTGTEGALQQECTVSVQKLVTSQPIRLVLTGPGLPGGAKEVALGSSQLGSFVGKVSIPAAGEKRELRVRVIAGSQSQELKVEQAPVKKWIIYVAPSTHTDIGYTDVQDRVIEVHNRNTDLAIELAEQYPLYHWNLESSWAAQMWLRDNPWTRRKLIEASRNRRIGIEAGYLNMLTGLCSQEELIRNMYYTANLARTHGVPFESLTLTDAPSHVWSVPSVLAGAGIKYLSCGVNQTRAPLFKQGINRKVPFWWEGPDGARVMTWLADGYSQAEIIGLKGGVQHMREVIDRYLQGWNARTDYPYDAILLHGAYSDNVTAGREIAESITEYTKRYAYPKVILAGNKDFFEHIEKNFADKVPVVRGCGGSWWEDGAASTAFETAVNRLNHERIAAAEAAWAVVKMVDAKATVPAARINAVWDNILLFDEHTWGAHNSITQPTLDFVTRQWAIKADYSRQAELESRRLLDEALHGLAAQVSGEGDTVLVFNPAGEKRHGVVEIDLPRGMGVYDGDVLLRQQVVRESMLRNVRVALRAEDVPALGYKAYAVKPIGERKENVSTTVNGATIENQFYKVTFDPKSGGVASVLDKKRDKELVDVRSPYRLGQLIYAHGGDEKGQTQVLCPNPAGVKVHPSGEARIEPGRRGAVMTGLRSVSKSKCFPAIDMEVVLYDAEPRIDIVYNLHKEMTFDKEAVYFAFPFAGDKPQFRYEIGGATVRPNEDHWPGGCRDWFSIQRWITMHGSNGAVALSCPDTPLVQLCEPQAGRWLDELPITNGTVLAYVMNNYWFTNYKAGQDGRFTFHYSLTSAERIDPAAATRFGAAVEQPMQAIVAPARGKAPLPSSSSFCEVAPSAVELGYVKGAEDGVGIVVRLHETSGQACDAATLRIGLPGVTRASLCNLVEQGAEPLEIRDGAVTVSLPPYGTRTIRLQ